MSAGDDDEEPTAEDLARLEQNRVRHETERLLLATLERRIGIAPGFFWSLRIEEDDWAFIVKLAVVCEAALTHALVLKIGNEQLYDHFADIQQSRRLELAKQLGIISDADRHTLGAIAQVRNSFAHRVENLGGSLRAYYLSRTKDEQIDLISKLVQLHGKDKPKRDDDMTGHAPYFKFQLFLCAIRPLRSIATLGIALDEDVELEFYRAQLEGTGLQVVSVRRGDEGG